MCSLTKHPISCFTLHVITLTRVSRSRQNNPITSLTHCDLTCRASLCWYSESQTYFVTKLAHECRAGWRSPNTKLFAQDHNLICWLIELAVCTTNSARCKVFICLDFFFCIYGNQSSSTKPACRAGSLISLSLSFGCMYSLGNIIFYWCNLIIECLRGKKNTFNFLSQYFRATIS